MGKTFKFYAGMTSNADEAALRSMPETVTSGRKQPSIYNLLSTFANI